MNIYCKKILIHTVDSNQPTCTESDNGVHIICSNCKYFFSNYKELLRSTPHKYRDKIFELISSEDKGIVMEESVYQQELEVWRKKLTYEERMSIIYMRNTLGCSWRKLAEEFHKKFPNNTQDVKPYEVSKYDGHDLYSQGDGQFLCDLMRID